MTTQIFRAVNRQPSDLFYNPFPLYLNIPVCISWKSVISVNLTAVIMHKGLLNSAGKDNYPIGASIMVGYRGPYSTKAAIPPLPATVAERQANVPIWIDRTGQNINGVAEHYWSANLATQKVLEPTTPGVPTWFQFEGWAFAQTDSDGLVNANAICKLAQDNAYDLTRMDIRVDEMGA